MNNEPTHGVKCPDGFWLYDQNGRVYSGTEREMMAQAENRNAWNGENKNTYVAAPLPISASMQAMLDHWQRSRKPAPPPPPPRPPSRYCCVNQPGDELLMEQQVRDAEADRKRDGN